MKSAVNDHTVWRMAIKSNRVDVGSDVFMHSVLRLLFSKMFQIHYRRAKNRRREKLVASVIQILIACYFSEIIHGETTSEHVAH